MEDYHVAKFLHTNGRELGLFAIFDGHLGDSVPAYLQKHLFSNILKEVGYSMTIKFIENFYMFYGYFVYERRVELIQLI